jgi:hypothetical protein
MSGRRNAQEKLKGSSYILHSNINGCIDMKMKAIDFILNQNAEKLEDLAKKLK